MGDHNNKAHSKGIAGEFLENTIIWWEADPTGTDQVAITGANALLASTVNQTAIQMNVNNFLGILGSSSTPIWPTDRMGELTITCQWEMPYAVLGGTAESSSATYTNNTYKKHLNYLRTPTLFYDL